jgi:hypothetical protein
MPSLLDLFILILLFIPFIIYYITLAVFCNNFLNLINDILVYNNANKIAIGGPGGAQGLEDFKGFLNYIVGISTFIAIMLFFSIGLLYFKIVNLEKLFSSDNDSVFMFILKNIFATLFVGVIGSTFLFANVVCFKYISEVSESQKYNESLNSKIRNVRQLAVFTISWTWLHLAVFFLILLLLSYFANKRMDNLFQINEHNIAYWEAESKERFDHRLE